MSKHLLASDTRILDLGADESAGTAQLQGDPRAAARSLGEIGTCELGVWQMTEGTVEDIEVDEVFVVLSGRATVRFTGETDQAGEIYQTGETIEIGAGSVVRLFAGEHTEWTVHETLRKLYLATDPAER